MNKKESVEKAISLFNEGYACAQSVLLCFASRYNLDENMAKLISSTFGGGMGRLRQKCGAVTGSFMVLGLAFGNKVPNDMDTKLFAYQKVRELNQKFENIYGTSTCSELIKQHATENEINDRKHHKIICCRIIEDAVGILFDLLESENAS